MILKYYENKILTMKRIWNSIW